MYTRNLNPAVDIMSAILYGGRRVESGKMMTTSNGNIFRVTCPLCGEFPSQRPETRSFDVFFDLHLNKLLSKQSWGWYRTHHDVTVTKYWKVEEKIYLHDVTCILLTRNILLALTAYGNIASHLYSHLKWSLREITPHFIQEPLYHG